MELRVFETPGKDWDEFASQYTDLIFYQSIWSELLRKGLGGQPLYFYLKEGDEIVAGLPGVLLNLSFFKIFYASIPYGGLIGKKDFFPLFMELIEKEFQRKGIDQARITESPFGVPYPFETFKSIPAKCSLLDLRRFNQERVWENYRGEVRRAIRKARNQGLSVKGMDSPEEAKVFYRLYLASMKRNRTGAKYPLQWFQALYDILIQKGKADIRFAIKENQYAAGVVLTYSSTSIHYLHNGSDPVHLENRPNDLIVDDIIQRGVKEGRIFLDFMGSDQEDLNLLRFKEKWGSQSLDIHTYVRDYHPLRSAIWEVGKRCMSSRLGMGLSRILRS